MSLCRLIARIAGIDGKFNQNLQTTFERLEGWIESQQVVEKDLQIVRLFDRLALFLQQRFEVLFSRLLTMKADLVMQTIGRPR